jgi:MacB-like periplasmic core domain
MLVKQPGLSVVTVLTIGLGMGANTAIFSVVNAVLLRPLAYKDSSSVVNVWGKFEKDGVPQNWFSEPEYWDLQDDNEVFSQIAAYSPGGESKLDSPGCAAGPSFGGWCLGWYSSDASSDARHHAGSGPHL